jgi:hypothetical protein
MDNLEFWENAEPLNYAFFKFADPYQREQYRTAIDDGRRAALQNLMYGDLFGHLASGALLAYGHRTAPTVSDGPVPIQRHCFTERPNVAECDEDIIAISGWRYERVQIVVGEAVPNGDVCCAAMASKEPAKVGRRDTYLAARAALVELRGENPNCIKQSASLLLDKFNATYARTAPEWGIANAPLAERTLRKHLQRFRQELAETGNN